MELRASWGDLAAHLAAQGNPTKLASLVNLIPGQGAWSFRFTTNAEGRLVAEVRQEDASAPPCSVEAVLSGVVPETLLCEHVEYRVGSTEYVVRDLPNALVVGNRSNELVVEERPVSWQPASCLRLIGYWVKEPVPPSLADPSSVAVAFLEGTYFGSLKYANPARLCRWRVLGLRESVFSSSTVRDSMVRAREPFDLSLSTDQLNVRLYPKKGLEDFLVRYSDYGVAVEPDWYRALVARARSLGVPPCAMEMDGQGAFNLTVFGRVLPGIDLKKHMYMLCQLAGDSTAIKQLVGRFETKKRTAQAQALNARIAEARTGTPVRLDGEVICLAPRAEQATVALLAKLEGMDALPFTFRSRAWTQHIGIDLIADFRLSDDAYERTNVPVELEYRFANFLSHKHPPQHVEMIICWTVEGSEDALSSDPRPWLFYYHVDNRAIPVIALMHIPGLSVGGAQ